MCDKQGCPPGSRPHVILRMTSPLLVPAYLPNEQLLPHPPAGCPSQGLSWCLPRPRCPAITDWSLPASGPTTVLLLSITTLAAVTVMPGLGHGRPPSLVSTLPAAWAPQVQVVGPPALPCRRFSKEAEPTLPCVAWEAEQSMAGDPQGPHLTLGVLFLFMTSSLSSGGRVWMLVGTTP